MKAVEVIGLQARRSRSFTLHIPHLTVDQSTIVCVAGPNGGGKTTLIESIAGLIIPASGNLALCGHKVGNDLATTRTIMGFIPDDEAWFVKELCAREYIELLIDVYQKAGIRTDMKKRAQAIANALLFSAFDLPLEQLSHGNKKKVQIIAGLMHEPLVIICDELRNGLDPLAIKAAEQLLRAEAKRGACVIAATHDLWWAERLADDILLLVDGKAAIHQPTANIIKAHGSVENLFMKTVGAA